VAADWTNSRRNGNLAGMDSQTTAVVIWVYGALILLGGIVGFIKAKSKPSLIAGGISGAVLLACGWAVWNDSEGARDFGLWFAVALAIILMMFFAARFMKSKKIMPAGLMAGLSFAALVMLVVRVISSGSRPW
jgi:uncharacterized membrane protein (UPF0136 family)